MVLSDKQQKDILEEYAQGGTSYRKLAVKYKVSTYAIRCVLSKNAELTQKITEIKNENTKDLIEHIKQRSNRAKTLFDRILDVAEKKVSYAKFRDLMGGLMVIRDVFGSEDPKDPNNSEPVTVNIVVKDTSGASKNE